MVKGIVMAAGQSLYDEDVIEKIKLYCLTEVEDIIILSTDRTLKYVLDNGLIPDYTCVNENIITLAGHDLLPDFFFHGTVKSHAEQITLYYNSLLTLERLKIFQDMGFKTELFNRQGTGTHKGVTLNTGGNCGMALVQIARHILNIDKIAVIGLDLDLSTSNKGRTVTHVDAELSNTKTQIVNNFFTMEKPLYNLTRMGRLHGKGIVETNIDDFLK